MVRRRCGPGVARPERRRTALAEAATSGCPARGATDQRRRRRGPGRGGAGRRGQGEAGTPGLGRRRRCSGRRRGRAPGAARVGGWPGARRRWRGAERGRRGSAVGLRQLERACVCVECVACVRVCGNRGVKSWNQNFRRVPHRLCREQGHSAKTF